jgi:hypothetical protein
MEGGTVVGLIFIIVVAVVLYFAVEGRDARLKQEAANAPPPPRQIAVIAQQSQMNGTGIFGAVLLAVTILIALLAFAGAKTVFGEIEAGIVLIAGTLLSGIALVLGRTHNYLVYRVPLLMTKPPLLPAEPAQPLHRWAK